MEVEQPESIETALDEALDAIVSGDPNAARRVRDRYGDAPEVADLMAAAGQIRGALTTETPSAEAQARHLQMIREAADRLAAEARPAPRRPRVVRRFVLRPVLAMGLLLALAAPGALALSARAMPGDALYSTKIAVEEVRLAMARDPAKEVDLHVEFAQRRVDELSQLKDEGLPARAVAPVLEKLQKHQQEAASGIATLKSEGRRVGPLEERVAVSLQQSTQRLTTIRTQIGCTTGSDARCEVIAVAVTTTEQTLRQVDEGFSPQLGGVQPEGGTPPEGSGTAPQPQAGEQPAPPEPAAGGSEPGGSAPDAPPAGGPEVPGEQAGGTTPAEQPPGSEPGPATGHPLQVGIDVKPTDDTNSLDIANRLEVPVLIRSTHDFKAADLDVSTVCFGDDPTDPANSDCTAGETRAADIDGDGYEDLVVMFQISETGIDMGDTEACFAGRTGDGRAVKGCDRLTVLDVGTTSAPGESPAPASGPSTEPEGQGGI
jgi:uncharacterized protein DUF5667